MRPRELLATSVTPQGEPLTLAVEASRFVVRVRGVVLMSSATHGSEEAMAEVGCRSLRAKPGARVLIGGLGMGFTVRATLDALGPDAQVEVVELVPALVEWNRGPLAHLASAPLDDPRVELVVADVVTHLQRGGHRWDAILLDVDNGPDALAAPDNAWLYQEKGLVAIRGALRPGGTLVVWSAFDSPPFASRLRAAGFEVEVLAVRARGKVARGSRHTLFVGRTR